MAEDEFDILVIGGGINGAAVARDAVGRGLSVYLAEAGDYACQTSSASSKMIHGGLRYLEQFAFRLVRESLSEREVLLRLAPHLVSPIRMLIPVRRDARRPVWFLRLGLLLYDALARRDELKPSGRLSSVDWMALPGLRIDQMRAVLHYSDCWVDDARLVLETILDARARGADVGNRRRVKTIERTNRGFSARVQTGESIRRVNARNVVNVAGAHANTVLGMFDSGLIRRKTLLVRGSHLVLRMPSPARPQAYLLQNEDGRVIFTLPFLNDRYLIVGTTDVVHDDLPTQVECTPAERRYLIDCYNRYFDPPVTPDDVIWDYAGLRTLLDEGESNPSKVSREYEIQVDDLDESHFITIYGGKLTTHRRLAEAVMEEFGKRGMPMGPPWTDSATLHGGELSVGELHRLAEEGPAVDGKTKVRWTHTYGSVTRELYHRIHEDPRLAVEIAPGVPEAELIHSVESEDAATAEDFLYRRTKLGLTLDAAGRKNIEAWFKAHCSITDIDPCGHNW